MNDAKPANRPRWLWLLLVALCAINRVDGSAWAQSWPASEPINLTIYSPGEREILGHSHYEVIRIDVGAEVRGAARYLNGESDVEQDRIELGSAGEMPVLSNFSHVFFLADGGQLLAAEADLKSGKASCNRYEDGAAKTLRGTLDFPSDTYAGATVLIPIEHALRQGIRSGIKFHVFNCLPGPRVLAVEADADKLGGRWASYADGMTRVTVRPDFGWFNLLAGPFLPKFYAWFDPAQDWEYLGGQTERFYRGPALELVRTQQAGKPAASASPSPQASPSK
jgi:hypothetical protein